MKENIFLRILWGILTFFAAVLLIILIIAFFFFLGCPYEFVKCYINRNEKDEEDEDYDIDLENQNKKEEENKELTCIDYIAIFFLIILGIFLQPLYLLFYILMAMMEVYRQCGCWIFWVYNS